MITLRGGRRVDGRSSERWVGRWESTPQRWLSGAVQAVPVLFETADENAGEALVELVLVGDRGRAGCLSVHAGIEPFELAPAEPDGGVEVGSFGADVVEPASAGVGVALGPGGGLFGLCPPRPPVRAVLSLPPGGGQAGLGSSEVGDGLAGLGAEVGAPPG